MELLSYLLKVSVCTATFYCFYYLFLKRNTFFGLNRAYLLATLVISFAIPAYTLEIERVKTLQVVVSDVNSHEEGLESTAILSGAGSSLPSSGTLFTWKQAIAGVYLLGAIVMVLIVGKGLSRVCRLTRLPFTRNGALRIVQDSSEHSNSSFFNYVFIDLERLSESEANAVIAHENVHVMRYHSLDKLLVTLSRIILWFNPFVYAYQKALEEVHEYEADTCTAEQYGQAEYATVLLDVSSTKGNATMLNHFAKSQLKKRINMLFQPKSATMKKVIYLLSAPVLLCLVYGFSVQYVYTYVEQPVRTENIANRALPLAAAENADKTHAGKQELKQEDTKSVNRDTVRSAPFTIVSSSRIVGKTSNKADIYDAEIHLGDAKLYSSRVEIDYDTKMLTSANAKVVSKATTLMADKIIFNLNDNTWTAFDHAEAIVTPTVKTLVIDAGHGGKDDAARGIGGVTEKELNLRAARIMKEEAEKRGLNVIMTRTEDVYMSLQDRAKMATGDLLISIHHQSFPVNVKPRAMGLEIFVNGDSKFADRSKTIAAQVLAASTKIGSYKVNEQIKNQSLYVLRNAQSPGFVLELGSMESEEDMAFIRNDENVRKICNLILDGVLK